MENKWLVVFSSCIASEGLEHSIMTFSNKTREEVMEMVKQYYEMVVLVDVKNAYKIYNNDYDIDTGDYYVNVLTKDGFAYYKATIERL